VAGGSTVQDGTSTGAALILDLDGVVTDTAVQHATAWRDLLLEAGLPFDEAAYERTRGLSRADSLRELLAGRPIDAADFTAMLTRKDDAYLAALDTLGPHDVLPGIMELVTSARAHGVPLAIGSSSRNSHRVLSQLGIVELFDAVADGSTGRAKPAPDIFLAAARMLGVEPSSCVVIEDAAAGIAAARAAGMRVIGVGPPERVGDADRRVHDTSALDLALVLDLLAQPPGPS
jgi:beta-phosphoglucomutase